jgi:hypothetical protein
LKNDKINAINLKIRRQAMRTAIITVLFAVYISSIYPQSDPDPYANGNGSIRETTINQNTKWVRRIHHQRIQIGDLSRPERLIVYSNPMEGNSTELFRLALNDYIDILEVIREENTIEAIYQTWLKISTEQGNIGWINIGNNSPYPNNGNGWQIIETLVVNGRQWTVRRQYSMLALWETVDVRDKPGFDSTIIFSIVPIPPADNDGRTYSIKGFAITEEEDTIDIDTLGRRTDHWVKIEDDQGRVGWIFGYFGSAERGGAKYRTPDAIIYETLGYY